MDQIRPGDRLIVFTTYEAADRVRDYFTSVKDVRPGPPADREAGRQGLPVDRDS
jgi:hypothetical protein